MNNPKDSAVCLGTTCNLIMQVIYKSTALKHEQEEEFIPHFFGFRHEITLLSFTFHMKSSV